MKKRLKTASLLFAVLFRFAESASAQDIDALVKKAVDELAAGRNTPITVSIKTPTIGSTDSVSAFSEYLGKIIDRNAVNNALYQVTPPARGAPPIRTGRRGQIMGSYDLVGDHVEVTLVLVTDPEGERLSAVSFSVSGEELARLNMGVLPENRGTEAEAQTQAAVFENIPLSPPPPAAGMPAAAPRTGGVVPAQSELSVQVWPNKESRVYYDGDIMTISLYASQDCWFKVYHIDVNNQMRMIYPNQSDRNNALKANTERVIPDNTAFKLNAPYGEETILAVFSLLPFENLERDMLYPVQLSPEMINRAAGRRGLTVETQAANIPGPAEKTAAARFSYTISPADFIEDVFLFKRPSDTAGAVQALRAEIGLLNGTFTGNEREGTYSLDDMRGSYRVSGDEFILAVRRPSYQSAVAQIPAVRGAGSGFNFSFDKPPNLTGAVASVKTAIENKGGIFIGDTNTGNFKANGIAGSYQVQNRVSVTIQEKPFIIPNQLIEKEVKNYFGTR
jgi:hypothetical protein